MRASFFFLAALAVLAGCKPENADDGGGASSGSNGRRDTVVTAASPLCAAEAQSYVAAKATEWWKARVDPTGRAVGPYSYAGAKAATDAPIAEAIAALHGRGVDLAPDPRAHRWEAAPTHVRLSLEGLGKSEPGFLATFELSAKGDALAIESLSILRGQTRWTCASDGHLVASR